MQPKLAKFWKKNGTGLLFISPWLIGFILFSAGPLLSSIWLSFTNYDIITKPKWIGWANYQSLLTDDPMFWKSLWVTVRYAATSVPIGIVVGVALALLLNVKTRGVALFRTILFMPSVMPVVATSVVFAWLLNPEIGLANGLLKVVGIRGPAWLQDTTWAPWSLVFMSVWGVGGSMVIYLAGLKDIPQYLYEASAIDGAGGLSRLRHVTLPLLTPVIFFNLVMGMIGAFQYFTQAYVMTQGGPEGSTTFYALYLFQRSWKYFDMGYACAMGWILFVVIMVITSIAFRLSGKWVYRGG
jgi:multiple sugar transport system permease protein